MTNIIREFVTTLDDATKRQIIIDNDQFERDGFIGQSVIRSVTERMMKDRLDIKDDPHVVMWMNILVSEIYRFYTHRFLEQVDVQSKPTN
jgi:hypothetical protein